MAEEVKRIAFSYQEIVEALVRHHGVREGIWGLYVEFGIAGANVGSNPDDLRPAAIVPIVKMGLQQFPEVNSLSVDAERLHPAPAANRPH